jgi:AcrR family transcriptional regulator
VHFLIDESKSDTLLPKIMRSAVHLFVERGIDGTSVQDIARRAGVSVGALYRHFKSKEDLAYHLFTTHLSDFTLELATRVARVAGMKDKIHVYISTCFEAYESERDLFTFLILSEHQSLRKYPSSLRHPGHVAVDLVKEGLAAGDLRPLDPYVAASILVGSIIRLCVVRVHGTLDKGLVGETDAVTDSLWRALSNE